MEDSRDRISFVTERGAGMISAAADGKLELLLLADNGFVIVLFPPVVCTGAATCDGLLCGEV